MLRTKREHSDSSPSSLGSGNRDGGPLVKVDSGTRKRTASGGIRGMLLRVRSDPLVRSVVLPGPETLDSVVVDTPEQRWCTTRFSYGKPDSHPANVWLLR